MHYPLAALFDQFARRWDVPIEGVSIGSQADRSTWHIQFSASATPAQRATESEIVASFDREVEETHAHDRAVAARIANPTIAALIAVVADRLGDDTSDDLRSLVRDHLLADEAS